MTNFRGAENFADFIRGVQGQCKRPGQSVERGLWKQIRFVQDFSGYAIWRRDFFRINPDIQFAAGSGERSQLEKLRWVSGVWWITPSLQIRSNVRARKRPAATSQPESHERSEARGIVQMPAAPIH